MEVKRRNQKRIFNTYDFVSQSQVIHNFFYSYEKSLYKASKCKLIITCPEHGDFEQIPSNHILGHGCQSCTGRKKHTTEEFINKCKNIHGDRYSYEKVVYKSRKQKVLIYCVHHGHFNILADNILAGFGCKRCGYEKIHKSIYYSK